MRPARPGSAERALVRSALQEDLRGTGRARGDLSTREFLPADLRLEGLVVAKAPGVVCGLSLAAESFRQASPRIRFRALARDGQRVRPGRTLAVVSGPRELLTGERTALNFLQRLSGVATLTRAFVDRVRGTRARILDTRKTLPGWRALDKYAVRCGGGTNHRMGLYDMVMLKDNHVCSVGSARFPELVGRFRRKYRGVPVLVEAKTRREVLLALSCKPDILLLDNMPLSRLRREIRFIRSRSPRTLIEISGGVSLKNVRRLALLGPDRISVGRLTHSAPALDMSLEL